MKLSSESVHEAEVLTRLPSALSREIGKAVVRYSNLEHQFTAIIAVILQLHKSEARLALQNSAVFESLDTVQDLLALKGIQPNLISSHTERNQKTQYVAQQSRARHLVTTAQNESNLSSLDQRKVEETAGI